RIEQSATGDESGGSGAVSAAVEATTIPGSDSSKVVFFPDWNISADQVRIENSGVRYDNNDAVRKAEGADYNHLDIENLDGELNDIQISKEGVSAVIGSVSLKESNGFSLKELEAKVQYKNHIASVRNLRLATTASEIAGDITLEYAAPDRLTKDFANCNLNLEIEKIKLSREDILLFVPGLAGNPFFQKSGSTVLIANTLISGKANDLTIGNLELSLSQATNLKAHGWIKGIPDYKKMDFDLAIDQLSFTQADLFRLIDSSGFSDLKFPEAFLLKGKTAGHAGSYTASASVMTSFGDLTANLWYNDHGTALEDSFKIDFDATKILAGKIIGDSLIGKLSASGEAAGRGIRHGPFTCSAGFTIHEAEYKSYKYSGIEVNSRIEANKITATASSDDPNLKFKLKADADLNDSVKKIAASMDLAMLNLKALNFTGREMAVHTGMTATLEYKDIASFKTDIELKNAGLINAGMTFPVKMFKLEALSSPDNFNARIKSDMAEGTLSGNIKLSEMKGIFQYAYRKYLGMPVTHEIEQGRFFSFRADFFQQQNILQQLIPGLEILKIKKLEGSYQSNNNEFTANLEVPGALFLKTTVDSLRI
ncbi:MAG TPA: hypothetical protein VN249_08425, partial [Prolixibacteraceae bacterium]|nr:hypothetical protein [Prolixibacteraceae bacterium]